MAFPALLVLALRDWRTKRREQLSSLRDSLALGSILVLYGAWLLHFALWLMIWLKPDWSRSFGDFEEIGIFLYSSLLGFALAFALRGRGRAQAISAAILMWAAVQAEIYF